MQAGSWRNRRFGLTHYELSDMMADFIRRNGEEIVYSYDAAGRLTRKDYPDGSWAAYTDEWPAT